ncbi:MAG: 50S ribosomal protein L4 [bacterium]|nr:50S ribosomal protein L4 [bacterium]
MKIKVYNQKGEETEMMAVPKEIFGVDFNSDLIYEVQRSQMANRRKIIAHTKNRGEVSGGGKKPWAQKGTGRARHGSIRSPIWRKGGVVFGPRKEKNFKQKINKKTKVKALFMVLSQKVRDNELLVLDKIDLKEFKTKFVAEILKNLGALNKSIIISLEKGIKDNQDKIILASRNINRVKLLPIEDLNALDLLSVKFLILTKSGINKMSQAYIDKKDN